MFFIAESAYSNGVPKIISPTQEQRSRGLQIVRYTGLWRLTGTDAFLVYTMLRLVGHLLMSVYYIVQYAMPNSSLEVVVASRIVLTYVLDVLSLTGPTCLLLIRFVEQVPTFGVAMNNLASQQGTHISSSHSDVANLRPTSSHVSNRFPNERCGKRYSIGESFLLLRATL